MKHFNNVHAVCMEAVDACQRLHVVCIALLMRVKRLHADCIALLMHVNSFIQTAWPC